MDSELLAEIERNIHLERLDESTLSRVWKHTQDPNTAFAMLTAYRSERGSRDENVRKTIALASEVFNAGYGYFWLKGYFIENEGTPEEIKVVEDSIFVISKEENNNERMKKTLLQLAKKYDQESIFFKPAGETTGYIISTTGEVILGPLPLRADQLGKYYSQFASGPHAGRTFKFESAGTASNGLSKYAKSKKLRP